MDRTSSRWPEKDDYDMAMETLQEKVHDSVIKYGNIQRDSTGIVRYGGANLYVTLYRVGGWIVRCFCYNSGKEPPSDILVRYQHISNFCQNYTHDVSALVPVVYVDNAIEVDFFDRQRRDSYTLLKTKVLPFVRMPFIEGLSLGSFVMQNHSNQALMEKVCNAWFKMIYEMEKVRMAHGDLDLTNIIVAQDTSGIKLKLIDYDNAWVPALAGYSQTEVGHEHFQHPAFQSKNTRPFDEHMDRFSALTMYISLKVLTMYPTLFTNKEWGADDTHHLLLTRADYEAEMQGSSSNRITLLHAAGIADLDPLLDELSPSLREKRLPRSLSELLPGNVRNWGIDTLVNIDSSKPSHNGNEQEEIEYTYYDWNHLQRMRKKDEPLVPSTPEPVVGKETALINPWAAPTQPVTDFVQKPTQVQTKVPSSVREGLRTVPPTQSNTGRILLFVILFLAIVAIIVAILWFTNIIPHVPAHTTALSWSVASTAHGFLALQDIVM